MIPNVVRSLPCSVIVPALCVFGVVAACANKAAPPGTSAEVERNCIAERPCAGRRIVDCPPGLEPSHLFAPRPPVAHTVVVATLVRGSIARKSEPCGSRCCESGGGPLLLTSDLSVAQANDVGTPHSLYDSEEVGAGVEFVLADQTPAECTADESGACCTFADEELANSGLVIARGTRHGASLIVNVELCRPRERDYPGLSLDGFNGLAHPESEGVEPPDEQMSEPSDLR